nr:uncharacterized protein LOC106687638 [Halyomorpha halys]
MCVRSDPSRCQRWLEETFSTFGRHVTEKVLLVMPGFFDEDDKIAVDEIRVMMRFLGLKPTSEQLKTLTDELDPNGVGYFLLDQSRPIFRFLADNLSSVEEVADEPSMTEALQDGYATTKEILQGIKSSDRRESFFNLIETLASDIGQLPASEFEEMFGNI